MKVMKPVLQDGLCATSCPVKIDTGKLIKVLRTEEIGFRSESCCLDC